ncbi:HET-domain-containing protein [Mollisia scopiformis]|uniref:HET-domain-containing protein n=1 Tax=Mollisia scopiformis TaxID=149040 RepID=A0A132B9D2_MOLSC|nr:HET-domain-containing protein [Mollisia scopiformis]KUJ09005.1 HET-domain-containing protein [Mollisia scopiformis]
MAGKISSPLAIELPTRRPHSLPWEREHTPIPSHLPRTVKSNLCDICLAFEENCTRPWPLSQEKQITVYLFPHHASWEELEQSCQNGCELCTLFRNGYLEQYHSQMLRDIEHRADETDSEESEDNASEADPNSTNGPADTRILGRSKSSGPRLDSDNGRDSEDSIDETTDTISMDDHKSSPRSLDAPNEADSEHSTVEKHDTMIRDWHKSFPRSVEAAIETGSEDNLNEKTDIKLIDHHKSSPHSPDGAKEADPEDKTSKVADNTLPDYYNTLRIRCQVPKSSSDPIRCCVISGRKPYSVWFNIGAKTGSKPAEEGGFRGRMCSATPDFDLAKEWIGNCHNHSVCTSRNAIPRENPMRLLQILNGSSQIRLIETVDSTKYEYVTLSYRWGRDDRRPPLTLQENLSQHMNGIPTEILPPTLKDAVLATVSLGYDYLWIDSLCIIQDEPQDFEQECPKMAAIYSGSAVTIAAPGAQDSFSGFLHRRKFLADPLYTPVELQYRDRKAEPQGTLKIWYPGSTSTPDHYGYLKPNFNGSLNSPNGDEPRPPSFLDDRGWIFQEWLLSPRVLYFGSFQMYFECCQSQRFETLLDQHVHIDHYSLSKTIPALRSHAEYHSWWRKLVERYSGCALSVARDRLPAISGIAHSYQPPVSDKYLAGIWQGDLPGALLWYRLSDYTEKGNIADGNEIEYIAPSWSWASLMAPVRFIVSREEYGANDPDDGSDCDPWKVHIISASTTLTSRFSNPDPFGPVKEGHLRILGKLHTASVYKCRDGCLLVCFCKHISDRETWLTLRFLPDRPSRYESLPRIGYRWDRIDRNRKTPEVFVLPVLMTRNQTFHSYVGLALEPVAGTDGEFQRVGLVKGTSPAKKGDIRDKIFSSGDEKELVIR